MDDRSATPLVLALAAARSRRAAVGALASGALAALTFAQPALAQPDATPTADAEQAAIDQVLFRLSDGIQTRDAAGTAALYTESAEWMSAAGERRVGRREIEAQFVRLFTSEDFNTRVLIEAPTASVRLIRPDVAVAWMHQEFKDQRRAGSGQDPPPRRNHSLLVLIKESGQWLITAQLSMDEAPAASPPATNATPVAG